MPSLETVFEPAASFELFATQEGRLRDGYLRLEDSDDSIHMGADEAEWMVSTSAVVLELFLIGACTTEALEEMGITEPEAIRARRSEWIARVKDVCDLDPIAVSTDVKRYFGHAPTAAAANSTAKRVTTRGLVRQIRSVLEMCPLHLIERTATEHAIEAVGYRCRRAFEGLQAFVLRNDSRLKERLQVVGREYVRGLLSPDQVALLLDVGADDAVSILQSHGYARSLRAISMSPDEETDALQQIRADRIKRKGVFAFSVGDVARDVIASERLEGIDARRWIPRYNG